MFTVLAGRDGEEEVDGGESAHSWPALAREVCHLRIAEFFEQAAYLRNVDQAIRPDKQSPDEDVNFGEPRTSLTSSSTVRAVAIHDATQLAQRAERSYLLRLGQEMFDASRAWQHVIVDEEGAICRYSRQSEHSG